MKYAIAIKREAFSGLAENWSDDISHIPGLTIFRSGSRRIIVEAENQKAINSVRERLGGYCHIEPLISHTP